MAGDLMKNKYFVLLMVLIPALLMAGCAGSFTDQPTQNEDKSSSEQLETPERGELRPVQTLSPGLEPVEIPKSAPVVGEVPGEILDEIIADLVEHTSAEQVDIQVVRAETVVWNDGALGCPKPGEFYIQMMINGYWVVLEVKGAEYDYRVSDKGSFTLCEGDDMPPTNSSSTGIHNPLIIQAKEDLAKRLGIPTTEIELLSFEEVVWPDASLGCPQPGMRYKQVPYDGALIRLSVEGQVYDYHSGGSRGVFLCEISTKSTKNAPQIDLAPPPGSADE
jgi:hypothetical protein